MAALHVPRRDLADLPAADRPPVHPTGLVRVGANTYEVPGSDHDGIEAVIGPLPGVTEGRCCYRLSRSAQDLRGPRSPGPPVTPPPGWGAPEPAR